MPGADIGVKVMFGKSDGAGRDVDAEKGDRGNARSEQGMEKEGYAAGAGA